MSLKQLPFIWSEISSHEVLCFRWRILAARWTVSQRRERERNQRYSLKEYPGVPHLAVMIGGDILIGEAV